MDYARPSEMTSVVNDILLTAQGLTKVFNGFVAVKGVNLEVRRGTLHALIGPNGAGKTTLFHLLTRFHAATRGSITFKGEDITRARPAAVARKGLVRSFQISAVFPRLTALENVRLSLQRKAHGNALSFWRPRSVLRALDAKAREYLDRVGLGPRAQALAGELPYGSKRALELATTLALEPELLLLDEPTAGMGHEDVERTAQLIRRVAADRTVLMVEHNLRVVADLSSRITVLARGEVLAEGDYATVSKHPDVIRAYLGSADV